MAQDAQSEREFPHVHIPKWKQGFLHVMKVRAKKRVIPQWRDDSVVLVEEEHPSRKSKGRIGIFSMGTCSDIYSPLKYNKENINEELIDEKSLIPIAGKPNLNSSPIIQKKRESHSISINDTSRFTLAKHNVPKSSISEKLYLSKTLQEESILKLLDTETFQHSTAKDNEEWSFSEHSDLSGLSE